MLIIKVNRFEHWHDGKQVQIEIQQPESYRGLTAIHTNNVHPSHITMYIHIYIASRMKKKNSTTRREADGVALV